MTFEKSVRMVLAASSASAMLVFWTNSSSLATVRSWRRSRAEKGKLADPATLVSLVDSTANSFF